MKSRRFIGALAAMAITGTLFAGCSNSADTGNTENGGNAGGNAAAGGEAVTLTVWGPQEGQESLKKMCESFAAANPDKSYTFNYGVVSEADAKKEALKDISAAADVFAFASDQTGELVSAGALYRITKNKEQIVADNSEPSIQAATVDGELYGYPFVSDTYFMYYDKSKFTEEEVLSLDVMLAKDIDGTSTNFAFDTDNGWYQSAFFFGAGCKLFGDDGTDPTQCDFNNDRGLLVGEYLIDLVKNPKFGANMDDGLIKAGFADGSVAAAVTGTWNAADIQASLGDNYAATKLPSITLPNGESVQLGGMANFKIMGVNSETKNPLDAMALAEWLTNYDNQVINFEERSFAPSNVKLAADTEKLNSNIAVAALAQQAQYATVQTSIPQSGNYWTPAEAFGQDLIAGNITKDNLQEKLDKYVESVLSALTSE
ncbi:MAG: extracellular solute-binding protein [Huintestinicola sp.]|uniref:extracellular solute-binding protein n=1 Tax=Huintestinicola sp. TaxID=2981661 RepID=UPI003F0F9AE2